MSGTAPEPGGWYIHRPHPKATRPMSKIPSVESAGPGGVAAGTRLLRLPLAAQLDILVDRYAPSHLAGHHLENETRGG